jgi:hypothetical protein
MLLQKLTLSLQHSVSIGLTDSSGNSKRCRLLSFGLSLRVKEIVLKLGVFNFDEKYLLFLAALITSSVRIATASLQVQLSKGKPFTSIII